MPTILVADDDPIMIKLYELNLKKAGYRVLSCTDGDRVLEIIKTETPDVAVLDYILPKKTGLELLSAFRLNPKWQNLPLIIITAQGKESTKNELLQAGATHVFTKPFSPTALLQSIKTSLS